MLRISGKVAGGWFGTQAISGGHLIPRTSDGSAVWTRAVKELPAKTTNDDLNKNLWKAMGTDRCSDGKSCCTPEQTMTLC